jgi:signal transduction histidine kinase
MAAVDTTENTSEHPVRARIDAAWQPLEAVWQRDNATPEARGATGLEFTEREQAEAQLREAERFAQATIEALTAHICVLDEKGALLAVNEAWRRFGRANPPAPANGYVGENYLSVCDRAAGPDSAEAAAFAKGLRAVMGGEIDAYTLEYPCHSPGDRRWFLGTATRFPGAGPLRVVVAHEDITERKRVAEQLERSRDELRALSHQLADAQEAERRHLARELHDEIGQQLTLIKIALDMLPRLPTDAVQAGLRDASGRIGGLIDVVRNLSQSLSPSLLDDLGLLPALLWHFERFSSQSQIRVRFEHSGLEGRRLDPQVEIAAYRIVQEALTNAARHAAEPSVAVRAWADADTLQLEIEDAGSGFDTVAIAAARASNGLRGMLERATALGGQVTIESAPGAGTLVRARLPLPCGSQAEDEVL